MPLWRVLKVSLDDIEAQEERIAQLEADNAALKKGATDLLRCAAILVMYAEIAQRHWDADDDMKTGKRLLAMAGKLKGYDNSIDLVHETIAKNTEPAPAEMTKAEECAEASNRGF